NVACTAARRVDWSARGDSSLRTVTHSSTYSRCRRRICRRAGSGTFASSLVCTVMRSGWLSAKLTCQRSSASSASCASAALGQEPLADVEQHLRQDRFLAGKVPVDAWTGHADGRADVVDGNAVEDALREQGGRCAQG